MANKLNHTTLSGWAWLAWLEQDRAMLAHREARFQEFWATYHSTILTRAVYWQEKQATHAAKAREYLWKLLDDI